MESYIIYLDLDDYLIQWVSHEYGDPVVFPKNSMENDIIEMGLIRETPILPVYGPETWRVAIKLPIYKNKDVRKFHYLPLKSRKSLAECIRQRFIVKLWMELHRFGHIGKKKQDLIWAWMEANGIEQTEKNYNTVSKIYQRRRETYRKNLLSQ